LSDIHSRQEWLSPANRWNASYIEDLYTSWKSDPASVPEHWQHFFDGFVLGQGGEGDAQSAPLFDGASTPTRRSVHTDETDLHFHVADMIFAYRRQGHRLAKIDPLGLYQPSFPGLDIASFGLTEDMMDVELDGQHLGDFFPAGQSFKISELLDALQDTYCNSIGVEYMHIQDHECRHWLQKEMETSHNKTQLSKDDKLFLLRSLIDAENFETFTHKRFPGKKRFSLEGSESIIPAVRFLVEESPELGVQEVVIGMAHRGRLNVLTNLLGMPYEAVFAEFEDIGMDHARGDGDVKYHKGYSSDYVTRHGKAIHLSLTPNPSHLEAVNPVVEGRARAKQRQLGDTELRKKVLPLLLHGDAAFAGQGLVSETLNLSQLPGYQTGGTVHLIVNNQIGFTTSPDEARSSVYATDVVKMIESPIFHVNGDDPEALIHTVLLALRFRQRFGKDVVIDMLCYRQHGHNESDEPLFTQPKMYQKIKDHSSVCSIYQEQLLSEKIIDVSDAEDHKQQIRQLLQEVLDKVRTEQPQIHIQAYEDRWVGLDKPYDDQPVETGVPFDRLLEIGEKCFLPPEGFHLNRKIKRQLAKRLDALKAKETLDWASAEYLAFGSLCRDNIPVRLSGQDSGRGTFSHRHAVWQDIDTEESYIPLNNLHPEQARFCVYNSLLSEAAVLGFEFGYAMTEPHMLIMWEAQFGDFANGAQVIIDQFITGSESKWQRTNGVVMLLPHGFEGQGPEHSNAYLERYLQACAEKNIQVCNVTTPAQYFHLLRRQVLRPFRRPLVLMAPKSLLRHPKVQSNVDEFVNGHFQEIVDDATANTNVERLALCSGKVYYDLLEEQAKSENGDNVAIVRVEQFYPLCEWRLEEIKKKYTNLKEVVWVQEEPQNRGGWTFMFPHLLQFFSPLPIIYVGRDASASPATASYQKHVEEQTGLCQAVFREKVFDDAKNPIFQSLTF